MYKSNFLAPTYWEEFITYENDGYFKNTQDHEWRGQLKSSTGNTLFRIKYYGELFEEYHLITNTDSSGMLVVAEDIKTGEQIILFDGCKYGYNAMFCDEYSEEQRENRPIEHLFKDKSGNDTFEIIISAYYGIDYDDEKEDFVDENNNVELIYGEVISFEDLKRNGLDALSIEVVNERGEKSTIIEEELA